MCEIMQKLQDEAEARGEARGEARERLSAIRNVMETLNLTVEQAMESLKIPKDKWESYDSQLR